jgi:hypothetical protein
VPLRRWVQQAREYVDVPFNLFSEDTLFAAQEDLGDEVITDKFIESYQLGINAQSRDAQVSERRAAYRKSNSVK